MEQAGDKPRAKRRKWWQFTLQGLLLLILLLSLPLAWVGNELAGKRREEELADAIHKAGGTAVQSEVNRLNIPDRLVSPWESADPFGGDSWTQAYRITRVELDRGDEAEFRAILARLKQLPYLSELDLSYTHLGDADLREVEQLAKLTDLSLAGSKVTDEGIEHLLHLPELRKLALDYTNITDDRLKRLAGLPSLQELSLTGTLVTGPGIARLRSEIPGLRVTCEGRLSSELEVIAARGLRLHGWRVGFWSYDSNGPIGVIIGERKDDLSKLELDCLKYLKRLDLSISFGAPNSINEVLPELAGLESLETSSELSGAELRSLTRCRNLKRLVLGQPMLSGDDWATFQEFPHLETLVLATATLTSRDIAQIARAKNLTSLSLHSGKFRAQDLAPLAGLARLIDLHLLHAQFEPGATEALGELKDLEYLTLDGSNLDDTNLLPLLQLKKLVDLSVENTKISDEGLLRLAEIRSLNNLTVAWSQNVTDEGRKRFRKLRPDVTPAE